MMEKLTAAYLRMNQRERTMTFGHRCNFIFADQLSLGDWFWEASAIRDANWPPANRLAPSRLFT